MNECSPESILSLIDEKEKEILDHTNQAYIFRSSVTYMSQIIRTFLQAIRAAVNNNVSFAQFQALRQIYDMLKHYNSILSLLSESKWIQPALNWPAIYVTRYIESFRDNLLNIIPSLGLVPTEALRYDPQQDHVNKIADYKALKTFVTGLRSQISINDAVGVQRQIETKINEISKLIPEEFQRRPTFDRRPSAEGYPLQQVRKRLEELLSQFKSINIEIDDLKLGGPIGSGGFGTVFKATRLSTAEVVAVKEIKTDRLTTSSWASFYAEVETMASVHSSFVLELVGAHITEPYRIITRFCPGKSLFDRLHRSSSSLTPTQLTRIAYQVAVGMAHLHSLNIVHRDLKTLNILLDENDDACVSDFGLSGIMKDNQELCGGVGTLHYTAPEVLVHSRYGPKVDIFSYAIVLWEMLMKKVPYSEISPNEIFQHVVTREWRLPIPQDAPEGLKKLISHCWLKDPNDRPAFSEIVSLFEKGEIYFPNSEQIDYHHVKALKRSPPFDFDYLMCVLKNPKDKHFSSLVYYICSINDDSLRIKLRDEKILEEISTSTQIHNSSVTNNSSESIESILVFASYILEQNEYPDFLANVGLRMFELCLDNHNAEKLSAALRFGLKVPPNELNQLKRFLPTMITFLQENSKATPHILQFLTRFNSDELIQFKSEIAQSLINVVAEVENQQTFNAISILLPIVKSSITSDQIRLFYRLLTCNVVVTSSFVSILIDSPDSWSHASLILSLLKAALISDINDVFLQFLQKCSKEEKHIFQQIYKMEDFFKSMQDLLESGNARAPLFLLYCIAPIEDAALLLANHPLLFSLIEMKGSQIQRLQIFSSLCAHEAFCVNTKYIDGIIDILVTSMSINSLLLHSVRLIASFSSHSSGCRLLTEKGVLELFTQLFLSHNDISLETAAFILRNVAKNNQHANPIPQIALVVSCLMRDIVYSHAPIPAILDTIATFVEKVPNCVQEYDLQKSVLPLVSTQSSPKIVRLALKLFSIVETPSLQKFYPRLLNQIYLILNNPKFMYPEVIEECLKVILAIEAYFDITEFIEKTQLHRFLGDVIKLLPFENPYIGIFDDYLKKLIH